MKQTICRALTIAAVLLGVAFPVTARANTVYDPTNHVQNILTALRTLKSNINEALMIQNQIKSLANEFENLKKLDFSIADDFAHQMQDLFQVTGTINGLMRDFNSLQAEFESLYPDFGTQTGIQSSQLAEQAKEWLKTSRETILSASQIGARVLANLPKSQAQVDELLAQSQGAAGIMQAAQAGNQLSANIAGNLQSLNAQLAAYSQAHMSYLAQQQASKASQAARSRGAMRDWGKRKTFGTAPLPGA